MCVLIVSTILFQTFLIKRKTEQDTIKYIYTYIYTYIYQEKAMASYP